MRKFLQGFPHSEALRSVASNGRRNR